MAFVIQDDTGTVANANAYVAVSYFKDYHDTRGNSYGAATDPAIEKAIVKATDYLDTRFSFIGTRRYAAADQPTAWPRQDATDDNGHWIQGIPTEVKKACCEYALRALTAALNPDPTPLDDSGRLVTRVSKSAGPVSKDISYSSVTTLQLPKYPTADRLLIAAGLLESKSTLARS